MLAVDVDAPNAKTLEAASDGGFTAELATAINALGDNQIVSNRLEGPLS